MVTCKDCPYWKRNPEDSIFDSDVGECHSIPVHDSKMAYKDQDTPVCFIYHADKFIKEHFKQEK